MPYNRIAFWCYELCINRWLQNCCCFCCKFYDVSKSETCVQSFTWKFSRFSCQLASLYLCVRDGFFFIFFNQTFFLFSIVYLPLCLFCFRFLFAFFSLIVYIIIVANVCLRIFIRLFLISLCYRKDISLIICKSKNKSLISMNLR